MQRIRRVIGYARVSSVEQGRTGTSLDAQQDEIRRYCEANQLPAPDIRIEVESAGAEKLERRTVLRRLLAEVTKGDLVVVAKQDRWSRDTLFFLQSIRDLNSRGVHFLALAERFDPETPAGRFSATVMAAVAEQERERIRERTVGRRRELRDQGLYIEGLAPVGYRRGPEKKLEIREDDAPIVRDIFRRGARGESLADILAAVRRMWPTRKQWDKAAIHRMLRSRVYLGQIRTTRGDWIDAHPPLVDAATFRRAGESMASRRLGGRKARSDSRTAGWLLRGMAVCAHCGSRMGPAYANYRAPDRGYYACSRHLRREACPGCYVRVDATDAAVTSLVLERLAELREELATSAAGSEPPAELADVATERAKLERRRARLIDLASDGTIGRDDLRARLAKIDAATAELEATEAAQVARAVAKRPELRAELLRDVRKIARGWKGLDVAGRREIVTRLAARVELSKGREPAITWRTVTELIAANQP